MTSLRDGRYETGQRIYWGDYGKSRVVSSESSGISLLTHGTVCVHSGFDTVTNEQVAIKLNEDVDRAMREADCYKHIQGLEGFPAWKSDWLYLQGKRYTHCGELAIELLGPSLTTLVKKAEGKKLSLKTTLQVADQIITRIEALHQTGLLHRDVRPENLCIGLQESGKEGTVYMIDFDKSKGYIDPDGTHAFNYGTSSGSSAWSSLNVFIGSSHSRRDDMESAGYVFVYCLTGGLPWLVPLYSDSDQCKHKISLKDLCKGLPAEFKTYLSYCRSLEYADEPDYAYCRRLFRNVFVREGYEEDDVYDWMSGSPPSNRE
ncbi:hypothetical protein B9479_000956 [Cryptococcus floricola]|uniref:Protein kinase domain-containing protein n=1 Tax=Cryptococcus floricola TaxID=2591691 RepID=A0A5D3B850_9TREE|nr:hypothetical protein B9479_000956 [Cryptococcus floricola]